MGRRKGGAGDEEGSLSTFWGGRGSCEARREETQGSRGSQRFTVTKKVRAFEKLGGSEGGVQRCERRQSLKGICRGQLP
jgi:hypothetical protein